MARFTKSDGVSALVRDITGVAEFTIQIGHQNGTHMEYLPYPDNNFHEDVDAYHQRTGKFTIEHIHCRNGQAFVPNVQVHVKSITSERTHAGFIECHHTYL
ncbi:unnamed protein product [Rotaria sp. Silwood1]|nr:unnamed protein product [Rotaria sp. Silwood1]